MVEPAVEIPASSWVSKKLIRSCLQQALLSRALLSPHSGRVLPITKSTGILFLLGSRAGASASWPLWCPDCQPCNSLPPFSPLKPSAAVKSSLCSDGLDTRLVPAQHCWSTTRGTCSPDKQDIFDQETKGPGSRATCSRLWFSDGLCLVWARRWWCSGKQSLLQAVSDYFIAHSGAGWDFSSRLQMLFKDLNSVGSFTLVLSPSVHLEDQSQPWIQRPRQNSSSESTGSHSRYYFSAIPFPCPHL